MTLLTLAIMVKDDGPGMSPAQIFREMARSVACALSVRNGPDVGKRGKLPLIR